MVRPRRQEGEIHLVEVVPLRFLVASPGERAGRRRGQVREDVRRIIGQGGDRDPEPAHGGGGHRVFEGGQRVRIHCIQGAPEGLPRKRRGRDPPVPPQPRLVVPGPDRGLAPGGHHPVQRG